MSLQILGEFFYYAVCFVNITRAETQLSHFSVDNERFSVDSPCVAYRLYRKSAGGFLTEIML
jgi:hypothetical protein